MTVTLRICAYILTMALVTYAIRMAPFVLFRKKINSVFISSMLAYMPYAVISAMVIPSVFSSTGSVITAAAGLAVACILAFFKRSLLIVALGASVAAYIAGFILNYV